MFYYLRLRLRVMIACVELNWGQLQVPKVKSNICISWNRYVEKLYRYQIAKKISSFTNFMNSISRMFAFLSLRDRWVIALMMEAVSTSETSVNFYQTTRHNNPEVSHLHARCRENLKSHLSPKSRLVLIKKLETLRGPGKKRRRAWSGPRAGVSHAKCKRNSSIAMSLHTSALQKGENEVVGAFIWAGLNSFEKFNSCLKERR
jgi:hypothetical protein